MRIKIIDLDGCIADDRWRRQLIRAEPAVRANAGWGNRFDAYHAAGHADTLVNVHELIGWNGLVVCTGRPVAHAALTKDWLEANNIKPLHILHRNNDDHRPSTEVKFDQVNWLLSPNMYGVQKEHIIEAIDDMAAVVKMYQDRHGIPARVVRIGDEEHANG